MSEEKRQLEEKLPEQEKGVVVETIVLEVTVRDNIILDMKIIGLPNSIVQALGIFQYAIALVTKRFIYQEKKSPAQVPLIVVPQPGRPS
jgi:hypothetical protein